MGANGMIEISALKTLIDLAPQLAGIVVMVILIRRMVPDKSERELEREVRAEQARILREVDRSQALQAGRIDDHGRRLDGHDEAIQGLAQQVQTTLTSGRH
jgi:hypothetical protein